MPVFSKVKNSALICLLLISWLNPANAAFLRLKSGQKIKLYDKSYALLVGAKDYKTWPNLPGVGKDIKLVKSALEKHGFKVETLINPTRETFDATIRKFISKYGQNEHNRLLFYYAGHGHTLKTKRGRELGYIIPSDTPLPSSGAGEFKHKAISMLEIEIYAKQMEAKHALFMFDSCFSGSLFEITRAVPASISQKTAKPVRQFITAGTSEQEVPDKSIFRQQFIAGLNGEADLNNDGFITGTELAQFLEDSVTNYSRRAQTPQYGKIRDPILDKGDIVFWSPKGSAAANSIRSAPAQTTTQKVDPAAIELSYWDSIKQSEDPAQFRAYLEDYPNGQFSKIAKLRLKRLSSKAITLRNESNTEAEQVTPPNKMSTKKKSNTANSIGKPIGKIIGLPGEISEGIAEGVAGEPDPNPYGR